MIRTAKIEQEAMDLTPMVDVTFLLLIFFMITVSFSVTRTMNMASPLPAERGIGTTINADDFSYFSVMVDVDAQGSISIDDEALHDRSRLAAVIAEHARTDQKTKILITSHYLAPHEVTVLIVDAAKDAGIQKIRAAMEPGTKPQ